MISLPAWARAGLFVAILLALAPRMALLEFDLSNRVRAGREILPVEGYRLPPPSTLRAMAFGYNELVADLLWVRSIAYYADHIVGDRDLRHIERYLKNILALDDRFKAVYKYGPAMIVGRGTWRQNPHVLEAIELLKRAHGLYPEEWSYPLSIGAYYMDLRSPSKRDRAEWKRQSADWVNRAALIGGTVPWLPSLAAKIYTEQGQRDLAIRHLEEIYLTTQDLATKTQILHKLRELRAGQIPELEQADRELREVQARSRISFVPGDLFVLLRQDPLPPFSLEPRSP